MAAKTWTLTTTHQYITKKKSNPLMGL